MFTVLFLCTGNSARSILAEAMLNDAAIGGGRFRAFSAGSHPAGTVHPLAIEMLGKHGIPTEGLRSKRWDEFGGPGAPAMHAVITVCDAAAAERCPVWPGHPVTAHWGLPDPAAVTGSDAERRNAFGDAMRILQTRVELLAGLPLDSLEPAALRQRLNEIGRVQPFRT